MAAAIGGLSSSGTSHMAHRALRKPIGMPGTAWCTGTGGSEAVEATEGLFATSSQDDNEGTAVQGVIKSHCPISDSTPINIPPWCCSAYLESGGFRHLVCIQQRQNTL